MLKYFVIGYFVKKRPSLIDEIVNLNLVCGYHFMTWWILWTCGYHYYITWLSEWKILPVPNFYYYSALFYYSIRLLSIIDYGFMPYLIFLIRFKVIRFFFLIAFTLMFITQRHFN